MNSRLTKKRVSGGKLPRPEGEAPRWVGICKVVLLLTLAVLVLLLVQSLVAHHFFSGGSLDNRGGR